MFDFSPVYRGEPWFRLEEGLAFLNAVLGGIGLISGILGKNKQARAQAAAAEDQARIAEANAELVDKQIADAIYRNRRETGDVIREGAGVAGAQRAAFAANNLDLTFGSPLDAIYNTQIDFLRDTDTLRHNLRGELLDLRREKVNFTASAAAARKEASNARSAGVLSVVGGIAEGIGVLTQPGGAWADII